MNGLPCVSNVMSRRDGCRIHGEHLSTCLGIRMDGQRVTKCTGCLPQPATRGMLCESCHERYVAALDIAVDLITHMRSIERGTVPDGPSVQTSKPGSKVIVPVSWQTADDTWATLHELAFRCDPLEFLQVRPGGTTAYGFGSRDSIEHVRDRVQLALDLVDFAQLGLIHIAELAVRFYRSVQRALHAFPLDEEVHTIRYARCRKCKCLTLERRPPLEHFEPIVVKCINPECGAVWDPAIAEVDLAAIRRELEASTAA